MDFPSSIIISSEQKKRLIKVWNLLNDQEKIDFVTLIKNEENFLKNDILGICQKNPQFLKKFKHLRLKRKMQILKEMEIYDQKNTFIKINTKIN